MRGEVDHERREYARFGYPGARGFLIGRERGGTREAPDRTVSAPILSDKKTSGTRVRFGGIWLDYVVLARFGPITGLSLRK
jgi:hypothetical protein